MAVQKKSLFADRLRGMQGTAEQAMADYQPAGVEVPEGIYNAKLKAELKESQKGKLMISRRFIVIDGEYKGVSAWDNLIIEGNPVGLQIARRWFETHGYAWPEDLADLEETVNTISEENPVVEMRLKLTVSGDRTFTNVTVNKVVSTGEAAEVPTAAPVKAPAKPAPAKAAPATPAKAPAAPAKSAPAPAAKPVMKAAAKKAPEPVAEEPLVAVEDLVAFCASQQVEEVTEGMALEDIVSAMKQYGFDRAELTEDEVTMLETVGLSDNIMN